MDTFKEFVDAQQRVASAMDFFALPPSPMLEELPLDNERLIANGLMYGQQRSHLVRGSFAECFDSNDNIRAENADEASKITAALLTRMNETGLDPKRYVYHVSLKIVPVNGEGLPHGWHVDAAEWKACRSTRVVMSNMGMTAVSCPRDVRATKPEAVSDEDYWPVLRYNVGGYRPSRPVLARYSLEIADSAWERAAQAVGFLKRNFRQAKPFQPHWMTLATPHGLTAYGSHPLVEVTPYRPYEETQMRALFVCDMTPRG